MRKNAALKIKEIESTLKTSDYKPYRYVYAKDDPGNTYFFESAFGVLWTDLEDSQVYYFIFPEHAEPVYFEASDWDGKQYIPNESFCINLRSDDLKEVK